MRRPVGECERMLASIVLITRGRWGRSDNTGEMETVAI